MCLSGDMARVLSCVCVGSCCLFVDQVAGNTSLELCGADESHESELSIWSLIVGIIIMLISISNILIHDLGALDTWNSLVNTGPGGRQLMCYVEPLKSYVMSLS